MSNPLYSKPVIKRRSRRMVYDMPLKSDALLDHNLFTSIVHHENPSSLMSLLGFGFGNNLALDPHNNNDPLFELKNVGISSSYIKIKEVMERTEPLIVVGNAKVPAVIKANQLFEVTLNRGILDPDENIHLRDMKSMATLVSRREGVNGTDHTFRMSGLPGQEFNGAHLFELNAKINYLVGNTQGEGSAKSNTLPGDTEQFNTFFNPMVVQRYKLLETGDAISDELYTLTMKALDGSSDIEFNTGLHRKWLRKVLQSWERLLLYSTANFNPQTYEIGGRNRNSAYPERPLFAGIYQQMDYAQNKWTHYYRDSLLNGLNKVDRIMQTLSYLPGSSRTYYAFCQGNGAQWLRKVLREGALSANPMRITVTPGDDDAITTGFRVEKYVNDYGDLYIYDVGKAMAAWDGNYDVTSYDGMKGNPRSNDIFFFNATTEVGGGKRTRVAKYFTKKGNLPGRQEVNRGFVFAASKGITGEGNGMSGAAALSMQDTAILDMINNSSRYRVDSLVDGNEYHALMQGTPYMDARGLCKLSLM